jgi:hypothetical protein
MNMHILNYAHPLTDSHLDRIEALTDQTITDVRNIRTQLDLDRSFTTQAVDLADAADLTSEQWQTQPILVMLPSLNYAAAALLAEMHGRMGYFPPIVRLRPVEGALPPRYELAEIVDLQTLRAEARKRR